jgi:glutathione synthase/RimK-type ligase-like ATP-grasp enzyme
MAIVIVVNKLQDFEADIPGVEIITSKTYLSDPKYIRMKNAKVFNICRSFAYQNTGYYISLLATARGHKVMPDITTIQDTKTQAIIRFRSDDLKGLMAKSFNDVKEEELSVDILFGKSINTKYQALSNAIFQQFQGPLLRAFFGKRNGKWYLQDVDPLSPKGLSEEAHKSFALAAEDFFNKKRPSVKKQQLYPYEMAILVNPDEKQPPSNRIALRKFIKAAQGLGIGAWLITKENFNELAEYDALFIRETTNVNHHTYRFARKAAVDGMVVLDDPESILKCSNKVYLAELLDRHNIPTPKTIVIHKDNQEEIQKNFTFPVILKMPDSCFSQGVKKAKNEAGLKEELKSMLDKSDLIIAQEFLPTDFDWRIGILNRKPLYACKYYMVGGHWQIMDWSKKGDDKYGLSETFSIPDVPEAVVDIALRAANLIGDGFYGVDVKEIDGKAYLVEVNDNPSIDSGIEDEYLKDELYKEIMSVFLSRMQKRKEHAPNSIAYAEKTSVY